MKNYLYLIHGLLLCLLLLPFSSKASHLVGSDLTYRCLGNNQYEISLTIYRDCENGIPWFDDPAEVGVYSAGNLSQALLIPLIGNDTLDASLADPCLLAPPTVCIHKTTYMDTITLPYTAAGYTVVYQRCCRNNTIVNILNPGGTGSTAFIDITADALLNCNSSPVFRDLPNIYLCQNEPLLFDHSATDIDGDSIVYELCTPYSVANGVITGHVAPPYPQIAWQLPYGPNAMLGTVDPLTIDPATGLLTGIPHLGGVFLVGVCAKEYRNGQLLSETRRDFQYKVGACQPVAAADFDTTFHTCDDLSYQFLNQSALAAGGYQWIFGNLGTSTIEHPLFTFPAVGNYPVTLIAGTGTPCPDTAFAIVDVQIQSIELTITAPQTVCEGDSVWLKVEDIFESFTGGNTNYNWGPPNAIVQGQGTDSVLVIPTSDILIHVNGVNSYNCQNTAITNVYIIEDSIHYDTIQRVCDTSLMVNIANPFNSNPNLTGFEWVINGLDTVVGLDFNYTFPDTGTYDVVLTIEPTSNNCREIFLYHIDLGVGAISLAPVAPQLLCEGDSIWLVADNTITNSFGGTQYAWTPASEIVAGQGTDSVLVVPQTSTTISVAASNNYGCQDQLTIPIDVGVAHASFDTVQLICNKELVVPFNNTSVTDAANGNYLWLFDTLGTSTVMNPTYTFPDTGHYTVSLIAGAGNRCADTATFSFYLPLHGVDLQAVPTQLLCDGDSLVLQGVDLLAAYSNSTQYNWSTTTGNSIVWQAGDSVGIVSTQSGTVTLIATNNHGCIDTLTIDITTEQIAASFDSLPFICHKSLTLPLQNTTTTNLNGLSYEWMVGTFTTSTQQNPTVTFPDTGNYTISLIAGVGHPCVDTFSMNVDLLYQGLDLQNLPDQTVCEGDTAEIKVVNALSAYATTTQYNWTHTGTTIAGQGTDSLTLIPNGLTAVSVIGENNYGCKDTATTLIHVIEVNADFDTDTLLCNTSLELTFANSSTSSAGPNTYQWDFAGLGTSSNQNDVFTFPDTGVYSIQLITEAAGLCRDTLTKDVALALEGVVLQPLAAPTVCENDSVWLTVVDALDAYSTSTQYTWTPAGAIVTGQGTDNVLLMPNATTAVQVIALNNHGCADTVSTSVQVRIVDALFDPVSYNCNTSLATNFQNTSFSNPAIANYEWTFGSASTSTVTNPTYTFPDTGNYTVQLIADAGGPCPDTFSRVIDVDLTGLEINATAAQVFCARDTAWLYGGNLYDTYTDYTNYDWQPSNLVLTGQGTDTVQVTIPTNTTFTVIGTNSHGCKDTIQTNGTIQHPSPLLTITVAPDSIFVGQSAQLDATDDINYVYEWSMDTTLSDWTIYNPIAKPRETTTYYLTVTNQFGCQTIDSALVRIRQPICDNPVVFVPSAFSPDGDGHNDVLMVNGNNVAEMTFAVFNRWGQQVFMTRDQNVGWDGTYKGKELPPGVYGYYMQCTCDEGGTLLLKGSITLLK